MSESLFLQWVFTQLSTAGKIVIIYSLTPLQIFHLFTSRLLRQAPFLLSSLSGYSVCIYECSEWALGLSISRAKWASMKHSAGHAHIVLPHDLQLDLIESTFSQWVEESKPSYYPSHVHPVVGRLATAERLWLPPYQIRQADAWLLRVSLMRP